MKKKYLIPAMIQHDVRAEAFCIVVSNGPADSSKVLSNERFIMEDMENEAAAAGEEDLW